MNPLSILKWLSGFGPVLFGLAFLAPLIAQSMDAASVAAPLGLTTLQFGLAIGLVMGSIAKFRGSWI